MKPNWEGVKSVRIGTGDVETIYNSNPGYTLRFFQDLATLPGNIDIKSKLAKMIKGDRHPAHVEAPISKEPDEFNPEIYEITAFGIEEVWHIIHYLFEKNNGLLEEEIKIGDESKLSVLTEAESSRRFMTCDSLPELFYSLKLTTRPYLKDAIEFWATIREESIKDKDKETDPMERKSNAAYQRLAKLLREGRHTTEGNADATQTESPAAHINAGLNTGEDLILHMQRVVVEVFEKQFNRPITEKEFKEISASGRSLVLLISSINNSIFPIVLKTLRFHGRHNTDNPLDSELFLISEEGGKKKLEIKFEVLARILDETLNIKFVGSTIKCPALLAPGQDGKNVIAEMYDWYESLTTKYILPELQKINNLHHDAVDEK